VRRGEEGVEEKRNGRGEDKKPIFFQFCYFDLAEIL